MNTVFVRLMNMIEGMFWIFSERRTRDIFNVISTDGNVVIIGELVIAFNKAREEVIWILDTHKKYLFTLHELFDEI